MTDRLIHAERLRKARQYLFLPLLYIAIVLLAICCGLQTIQMELTNIPGNIYNVIRDINTYFIFYPYIWGGILLGLGTTVLCLDYIEHTMRKPVK